MLEEIYEDNLIGDPNDLERILEPENDDLEHGNGEDQEVQEAGQEGTAANEGTGETKIVKRVVKRPQPKLNPERLTGPRGIIAIEEEFRDFKFCGKGHEKVDLDRMMKKLEHWAHRLFPRFQFDDCLEKIEKLGVKRPVVTYVKKIRMGMEVYDATPQLLDDDVEEDNEKNIPQNVEPFVDPFEELLGNHLSQRHPNDQHTLVSSADQPSVTLPSSQTLPVQLSQTLPSSQSVGLTTEQRERILKNRLLAEQKRLERYKMKQEMEKKTAVAEQSVENDDIPHIDGTEQRSESQMDVDEESPELIETLQPMAEATTVKTPCEIENTPVISEICESSLNVTAEKTAHDDDTTKEPHGETEKSAVSTGKENDKKKDYILYEENGSHKHNLENEETCLGEIETTVLSDIDKEVHDMVNQELFQVSSSKQNSEDIQHGEEEAPYVPEEISCKNQLQDQKCLYYKKNTEHLPNSTESISAKGGGKFTDDDHLEEAEKVNEN